MVNYLELPVGDKAPEMFNVVIEIPAEGINKYEYDKELQSSGSTETCIRRCIIPAIMASSPRR